MATPYNIETIIGVADVCQYLAQNAVSKSALFRKPPFRSDLPTVIYVENDSLRYLYNYTLDGVITDAIQDELDLVANYVWSLCVYTVRAYNIYANGNGGVLVPTTPGTQMPLPYDFVVNTTTSFIIAGVSSTTITLFIGRNIEFIRGSLTQYTTDPGDGSTWYSWDRNTGLFVLSVAADEGERFRISAV